MNSNTTYNPILDTDSYKASHWRQYPPGTEYVYSYIESRGGQFDRTVWFGLQYFLKRYLTTQITAEMVNEAEAIFLAHGEPFYREGWEYIVRQHNGYIPLEIRAVPEGSVIPVGNVLATVVNTDPHCYWVTSYFETALLRAVWYPTTVATNSYHCKQIIAAAMQKSSDSLDGLAFKLHDFGARGVSSYESSAIGGAAHLVNFMGTDTVMALPTIMRYYKTCEVPAFSIPAAEHSTMTAWGEENEAAAYRNMLNQFKGRFPLIAVVSDSWNIYEAVDKIWGAELQQEVLDSGSMVVIRPDSGEPTEVVPRVLQLLDNRYGSTVNSKGYKVLRGVRVIQGDGITLESIPQIIAVVLAAGFSMDNLAFGMGGGLLQMVNRDTQRFAMKCSAIFRGGDDWVEVYKQPSTDSSKISKRGRLRLIVNADGEFRTVPFFSATADDDLLQRVFFNGHITQEWSFAQIRQRAAIYAT